MTYVKPDDGRDKGEFDVFLYDPETLTIGYVEVKSNHGHWRSAEKQLYRAKDHFEELGCNFEGYFYSNMQEVERMM